MSEYDAASTADEERSVESASTGSETPGSVARNAPRPKASPTTR